MTLLAFLGNENLMMIAELLVIIIGSMLLGILLSYFSWGSYKNEFEELQASMAEEKRQSEDLRDQVNELLQVREHFKKELSEVKLKIDTQARTIYDQQHQIFSKEAEEKNQQKYIDELSEKAKSYQERLQIVEGELSQVKSVPSPKKKGPAVVKSSVNYEHVSELLGRHVTENDLTLIAGIGPKIAAVLQAHGIKTWKTLADAPIQRLRDILAEEGGIYKSLDPATWARQARMAVKTEWRKLRVYQEKLKSGG
jgi:predicted flap endonuclease-1-like 5' DNA nuclease